MINDHYLDMIKRFILIALASQNEEKTTLA